MYKNYFKAITMAWATTLLATSCSKDEQSITPQTAFQQESGAQEEAAGVCPTGSSLGKPWVEATGGYGCYVVGGQLGANLIANKKAFTTQCIALGVNPEDFLAEAMLETEDMSTTYIFGDKYPPGVNGGRQKMWDAANFGACKFNVFELRKKIAAYASIVGRIDDAKTVDVASGTSVVLCGIGAGQGDNDSRCWKYPARNPNGGLNGSKNYEVQVFKALKSRWGADFFNVHRWGCSGLGAAGQGEPGWMNLDTHPRYGVTVDDPNGSNVRMDAWRADVVRFKSTHQWTKLHLQDGHRDDAVRFYATLPAI